MNGWFYAAATFGTAGPIALSLGNLLRDHPEETNSDDHGPILGGLALFGALESIAFILLLIGLAVSFL
jgi:hypothetical protein